ncbi:hypothetical protein CL644_02325 [bacterium]|mgnify:CR=1|nr:hypothetical protein [Parcubacteria group bacterium]MBF05520.1 hypothetical protein [bacterium]|tara:strand:+ start:939 stop:1283 length:345 start_codon:yes stop_codon:yes gene_type:complete
MVQLLSKIEQAQELDKALVSIQAELLLPINNTEDLPPIHSVAEQWKLWQVDNWNHQRELLFFDLWENYPLRLTSHLRWMCAQTLIISPSEPEKIAHIVEVIECGLMTYQISYGK